MSLLEQLDAAERALAEAERKIRAPRAPLDDLEAHWHREAYLLTSVQVAAARCMAAAARCLVTTEDISDGPVPPPERVYAPDFLVRNVEHPRGEITNVDPAAFEAAVRRDPSPSPAVAIPAKCICGAGHGFAHGPTCPKAAR